MGFEDGDLLISCTEGGETPYVIGATEQAARLSSNTPYFLYCNVDTLLTPRIERCRRVFENPAIHKLCLHVGPMALTGSTRMQASTVLQLAVGLALLHPDEPAQHGISRLCRRLRATDPSFLSGFTATESAIYRDGDHVTYRVEGYGITVLTDTTERAPTFSLMPFERVNGRPVQPSLCYVSLDGAETAADAWRRLLNREPRALDWPEIDRRTTADYLQGFDFSVRALDSRRRRIRDRTHHEFTIRPTRDGEIELSLRGHRHRIPTSGLPPLFRHLLLKLTLNTHSTLVMGRLGRYENNLMTWVLPTNGKLVDRAVRYVKQLLADAGRPECDYEQIVRRLFTEMDRARPDESVVLRTFHALSGYSPLRRRTFSA
jgi:N-acetylmuramic acid 6-phosphate etherase